MHTSHSSLILWCGSCWWSSLQIYLFLDFSAILMPALIYGNSLFVCLQLKSTERSIIFNVERNVSLLWARVLCAVTLDTMLLCVMRLVWGSRCGKHDGVLYWCMAALPRVARWGWRLLQETIWWITSAALTHGGVWDVVRLLAAEQRQVSSTEWWMTRAAAFFIYRNI